MFAFLIGPGLTRQKTKNQPGRDALNYRDKLDKLLQVGRQMFYRHLWISKTQVLKEQRQQSATVAQCTHLNHIWKTIQVAPLLSLSLSSSLSTCLRTQDVGTRERERERERVDGFKLKKMISILPVCTCSQVGQANSSTLASPLILFCCSSSLFIFSLSFYTHFLSLSLFLSLTQRLHLLEIFSMLFTTNLCFYSRRYTSRCLLASTCLLLLHNYSLSLHPFYLSFFPPWPTLFHLHTHA